MHNKKFLVLNLKKAFFDVTQSIFMIIHMQVNHRVLLTLSADKTGMVDIYSITSSWSGLSAT